MKTKTDSFRVLSRYIAPAVITLSLITSGTATADSAGVTLINQKLATIPGMKAGTTVATAKSSDLLYALTLALDTLPSTATGAQVAAIVESALQKDAFGKFRKDKDKIAGDVIATAIANNNLTDASVIATITKAVFNVNSTDPKAALTLTGRGVAISGALKSSDAAASLEIGNELGGTGATDFSGTPAEVALLLENTAKALGTSAAKAAASFESFSEGFLNDELADPIVRQTQANAAAVKIASKVPAGAGSILGGYIATLATTNDAILLSEALGWVGNTKLAKALGDIIGSTMEDHTNKVQLGVALSAGQKDGPKALIAQGVLRAGTATDAPGIMDAYLNDTVNRAKVAGTLVTGSGGDQAKLSIIVGKLGNGQDDVKAKPAIGSAVLSAIGALNPEAADPAIKALIDSGNFLTEASRNNLGVAIAPKVKAYSAVGYMAAGIAERNIAANPALANTAAVETARLIMAKASKAATDVAYRTAALSSITDKVLFAVSLANANPKFSLNAAVGSSLADESRSGDITAAVINRPADKSAIAKASAIAGAVAKAVDEERGSDIAIKVGALFSETGAVAGKPLKASSFKTFAKELAKAIQAKANVDTTNRMDELGEIGALITNAIVQAYGGNTLADAKKIKARDSLIVSAGAEIMKNLSKKALEDSKNLQADQSTTEDIGGSIALTIQNALPEAQSTALLAPGGALEKTFLKYAGKAGTPDSVALLDSLNKVRTKTGNYDTIFEDGTKNSPADFQNILNDKETDKRNG